METLFDIVVFCFWGSVVLAILGGLIEFVCMMGFGGLMVISSFFDWLARPKDQTVHPVDATFRPPPGLSGREPDDDDLRSFRNWHHS